jgi:exodeoxyribonuclease V alpha subunit
VSSETVDPLPWDLGGLPHRVSALAPFVDAGVFGAAEVHLADTLVRLSQRDDRRAGRDERPVDDLVVLAAAVAARAPRSGHVGVRLDEVAETVVGAMVVGGADGDGDGGATLDWPEPERWEQVLRSSPLVADAGTADDDPVRPLVFDRGRLYLHRLWSDEVRVADRLRQCAAVAVPPLGDLGHPVVGVDEALARVFGTDPDQDRQHLAGVRALQGQLTVVVGGPGTGKTRTIARLLAAALLVDPEVRIALCAPTGKAAARMTDAVRAAVAVLDTDGPGAPPPAQVLDRLGHAEAVTVHRLLGARPGGGVRHDRRNPLPHDLVVVDETSMVDLPLMAKLVDALSDRARLVLVGDPDQLASVEAGTVLADIVGADDGAVRDRVVELTEVHRFGAGSGIAELAAAIREGRADDVVELLSGGHDDLTRVEPARTDDVEGLVARVVEAGVRSAVAAREGRVADALRAARECKVLCAVRRGPWGLHDWTDRIDAGVADVCTELRVNRRWEVGRPFLVTRNDPVARVANGDTGVVVDLHGTLVLAIDSGGTHLPVPVARLDQVEPWWAMTIHKSQGSEFDHVVVSLPTQDSPVLTRELLYTAVTRAKSTVTVLADEDTIRRAVDRPVSRASGLRDRLA